MKRHIWCVITIAAIILLAIITLSFGKDVNLVSHLSLTSAVVSIVLAVIVIVYMYFQDQRSSQNITEMRKLIDEGHRTMTDKAGLMVDKALSMEQQMTELIQSSPADSKPTTPPSEIKETFRFNASVYSRGGIIVLYSLMKSYEVKKPISWRRISGLIEEDKNNARAYCYYSFGLIQSLEAFLKKGDLIWSVEQQEVKKLPDGFKKSIDDEIHNRLEKYKNNNADIYTYVKNCLSIIDDYFDNL